jgi:crotonobetainyl-CoA:carnitine CoA-transferase CaiB-like acyl-CoA transferase
LIHASTVPGRGHPTSDDVGVPFLPLDGVRVVDVTSSLAGPYCTQILGALGADVVKIEHPRRGDEGRAWGPAFDRDASVIFFAANASKRSLGLDLKTEAGRDALLRLSDRADVFIQSMRPGTAERLGLGARDLRAQNRRLVYCSVGAYGRRGPRAHLPGYDPLMQAAGGIMSMTGEPGETPVRVGTSLVDLGTGVWSALAIVAALHERERTGAGRTIDVSLYETALALISYQLADYLGTGRVPGRFGSAFALIAPYQVFATRDGRLMVAAANDGLFAALCEVLGRPDVASDPRYATNPLRVERREELVALLAPPFERETTETWVARLDAAGVPAAPVRDVGQVAEDEQTRALGILQELDGRTSVALPLSLDGERVLHRGRPPALGEHSRDLLRELGYSEDEIAELVATGVVRVGDGPAR